MGKDLLQLNSFKRTIDACAAVLKTVDFDLYALFETTDKEIYDNVLNSFVGITCIQVSYCS
jgi:fatty acid synthase